MSLCTDILSSVLVSFHTIKCLDIPSIAKGKAWHIEVYFVSLVTVECGAFMLYLLVCTMSPVLMHWKYPIYIHLLKNTLVLLCLDISRSRWESPVCLKPETH